MIWQKQYTWILQAPLRSIFGTGALGLVGVLTLGGTGAVLGQPSGSSIPNNYRDWQGIFDFLRQENDPPRTGQAGGSRDPELCLVSPGHEQTLWHRNPIFLWQGNMFATGVRLNGESTNVLWRTTGDQEDSGVYQAHYEGTPLATNENYDWLLYGNIINPNEVSIRFPFQIMDVSGYEHHAAELIALQHELEAEGADEDAIALARTDYFLANNLPNDAVQVMFSVAEPSAELQAARSALVKEICDRTVPIPVSHPSE